ncbi:MAG: serine protease [Clostridiales bacterium]|nr:serine protease [Clostridiales bacterium]
MRKFKIIAAVICIFVITGVILAGCTFPSGITDGLLGRITDETDPPANGDGTNITGENLGGSLKGATVDQIALQTTARTPNYKPELPDVIEEIEDSVVVINVELANGKSSGSGVLFAVASGEGYSYLITCLHVVEGHKKIRVTLANESTYEADFVGGVPDSDIAVLRIRVTNGITVARFRNTTANPIRKGESVVAIGNPLGTLSGTVTEGIISAIDREMNIDGSVMTLLQTSAAINSGNSGGGLFDNQGLLIGMVNAKSVGTSVEGLGYAIPIDTVIDITQKLLDTRGNNDYNGLGYIPGKKMLGITTISGEYNTGSGTVYASKITVISPYGSAASAGLAVDDLIIKVDDVALSQERTLGSVLAQKNIGDTMKLTILRQSGFRYNEITRTVTLKQYVYGYNQ